MPAVGIRKLEADPLERARRKTIQPIDGLQSLHRLECFPRVTTRFLSSCDCVAKCLACHVIVAPRAVIIRVDHLGGGDVSGLWHAEFSAKAETDMALANLPIVMRGFLGE